MGIELPVRRDVILASTMVEFNERFETLPGKKMQEDTTTQAESYEALLGAPVAE